MSAVGAASGGGGGGGLEAYPHVRRVGTRWNDDDAFGHLNNTTHYAAMDTTVTSWLVERGGADLRSGPHIAVVAESGCVYHASASFPDELAVGLRAVRLGRTSVTWGFGLYRARDGLHLATGHWVHVVLDRATGRPAPVPDVLRERITRELLVDGGPGPAADSTSAAAGPRSLTGDGAGGSRQP